MRVRALDSKDVQYRQSAFSSILVCLLHVRVNVFYVFIECVNVLVF